MWSWIAILGLVMVAADKKLTDTLPRASIQQILAVLRLIAGSSKTTFEDVRLALIRLSARRAPASQDAKWTTARDVVGELQRLGYLVETAFPRQKNVLNRLRHAAIAATDEGRKLADFYDKNRSHAFDEFLRVWLRQHRYFRAFLARLLQSPLYVPDITSIKDLNGRRFGKESIEVVARRVAEVCSARLDAVSVSDDIRNNFSEGVLDRFDVAASELSLTALDAKALVDAIEDRVVVPALLAAEGLPFDPVTFQHLVKASQDFFVASWTSSHPDFPGRIVFSTCDVNPAPHIDDVTQQQYGIIHHGKSYAAGEFEAALDQGYQRLAGGARSYVDAYQLRAVVCVRLGIQPAVFAACLEQLLQNRRPSLPAIYTEIPFEPPPKGEPYVEVGNNRVGRLKFAAS
jgi:hypothetical protein